MSLSLFSGYSFRVRGRSILAVLAFSLGSIPADAQSVLRNGGFEGESTYWYAPRVKGEERIEIVESDARDGRFALRFMGDDELRSAAFPGRVGERVNVGLWVKSPNGRAPSVTVKPAQREAAQKIGRAGRVTLAGAGGSGWTWYEGSVTLAGESFNWWPGRSFILSINGGADMLIDGVRVWPADRANLPRREIEAVAAVERPRVFADHASLFDAGAEVGVTVSALNAGGAPRSVSLAVEWFDYEGKRALSAAAAWEKSVELAVGASHVETVRLIPPSVGLMLARLIVRSADGAELDRSDAPVTVLAYPKAASTPDPRERFGTGARGVLSEELARRIGFGWVRWGGFTYWSEWERVEDGAGNFNFERADKALDSLASRGMSQNAVLYSKPPHALRAEKGMKHRSLPRDVADWGASDPRWQDLGIETSFDRYVRAYVSRYKDRAIVWELANEPELEFRGVPEEVVARFLIRTARVTRSVDPDAFILYNSTWPGVNRHMQVFFEQGGGKLINGITYHNYSTTSPASAIELAEMREAAHTHIGPQGEYWFNEGWTFVPSSRDDPAVGVQGVPAAEVAHRALRYCAESIAAGQQRTIFFHIAYHESPRSYWDWLGSGTELWDDDGTPTVMVAGWNSIIEHLGRAHYVRTIRPTNVNLLLFQNHRSGSGLAVAWVRSGGEDVTLRLPLTGVVRGDAVGRFEGLPAEGGETSLTLRGDGQPVYLSTDAGLSAEALAKALESLDAESAAAAAGGLLYRVPSRWSGGDVGSSFNNPAAGDGILPLWRLDQISDRNPLDRGAYQPLVWSGKNWHLAQGGGQASVTVADDTLRLDIREDKLAAVVFRAPADGRYRLANVIAGSRRWRGDGDVQLDLILIPGDLSQSPRVLASVDLRGKNTSEVALPSDIHALKLNDRLVIAPVISGADGWHISLRDVQIERLP